MCVFVCHTCRLRSLSPTINTSTHSDLWFLLCQSRRQQSLALKEKGNSLFKGGGEFKPEAPGHGPVRDKQTSQTNVNVCSRLGGGTEKLHGSFGPVSAGFQSGASCAVLQQSCCKTAPGKHMQTPDMMLT